MPPTPPMAANKVIITVSAASDASDAAHGCEQGDFPLSEAGATQVSFRRGPPRARLRGLTPVFPSADLR
jgi:hypothetical protein